MLCSCHARIFVEMNHHYMAVMDILVHVESGTTRFHTVWYMWYSVAVLMITTELAVLMIRTDLAIA